MRNGSHFDCFDHVGVCYLIQTERAEEVVRRSELTVRGVCLLRRIIVTLSNGPQSRPRIGAQS